eukprot:scaffold137697_cov31-Tisochrysis_lutea.AAC.2
MRTPGGGQCLELVNTQIMHGHAPQSARDLLTGVAVRTFLPWGKHEWIDIPVPEGKSERSEDQA